MSEEKIVLEGNRTRELSACLSEGVNAHILTSPDSRMVFGVLADLGCLK